jgi:anti-sigma regulatory factor (Ser/Thr protein kinase)
VSQLVVEEVVRNLIEHTPRDACVEEVSVAIAIADDHVDVVIDDRRPSFDPGDAPPLDTGAPLDERSAGGMGLHLVREMTDVLDYERTDDGNRLTARIGR